MKNYKKFLTNIEYKNPLITPYIYEKMLNNNLNIQVIEKKKSLNINNNIIKPFGFYKNNLCEVIMSDYIFNNDDIKHLNNIIDICKCQLIIIELNNDFTIYKTTLYEKIVLPDNLWASPSQLKNYILKDTLLDYFKYNKKRQYNYYQTETKKEINNFQQQIFEKGNEYETKLVNEICSKFNNHIIIGNSYDAKQYKNYAKTCKAIKDKIPIIFQATLWNYNNMTFGCADMLINSNFINNVFPDIDNKFDNGYQVFDFKWSKIQMLANSDMLYNTGLMKVYKSQMKIYVDALNNIQSNKITKAYIIAREIYREKITNKEKRITTYKQDNLENIRKLGIIDYELEDIDNEIINAIKWLKFVKINDKLEHDPPNDIRLYPNMKNQYDNGYQKIKYELAEKNKEITLLYNVNIENRNLAIQNGITKYDDIGLNSNVLGITGKKRKIIDDIIDINRQDIKKIKCNNLTNYGNWRNAKTRIYLDIETINNVVYELGINKTNYIFMIGLGIVENNKWDFKCFITDSIDIVQEKDIILKVEQEIKLIIDRQIKGLSEEIPIFHWGNFENYTLKPLMNIKNITNKTAVNFYDMNKWFLQDEIFIKDALNYKLKTIINALIKNNLLNITLPKINNGSCAMDQAYKYYMNRNGQTSDNDIMNNIREYNELDCRAMFEIHNILSNI
jgi:hypothetical protein